MSNNLITDLEEFTKEMAKYDDRQAIAAKPSIPDIAIRELRVSLIEEEIQELITNMYAANGRDDADGTPVPALADIADGIADSIVVLIGTALAYGIPLQRVWDEVHRTNMDKLVVTCVDCNGAGEPQYQHMFNSGTACRACKGKGYVPRTDIRKRSDGKILKPDGWQKPQIEPIIKDKIDKYVALKEHENNRQEL